MDFTLLQVYHLFQIIIKKKKILKKPLIKYYNLSKMARGPYVS